MAEIPRQNNELLSQPQSQFNIFQKNPMSQDNFNPWITGLASGLFSWIADLLLYPVDTLSTRLKGSKTKPIVSTMTFLRQSIAKEGRTLYRGVSLTFPHSFVPTYLYVFLYEHLLHKTSDLVDKWTSYKHIKLVFPFFLSAIAEGVALILELPFDTVRTRMQMNLQEYKYSTAMVGLKQIYYREGLLRFYKSTKIYMLTKTLYTASLFQFYEMLNYKYSDIPYSYFVTSPLAATLAAILVNPLEVVITRYALVDTSKKKLVLSSILKTLWERQGLAGFYKGFVTEVITKSLYFMIWMPVFQLMRDRYGVSLAD